MKLFYRILIVVLVLSALLVAGFLFAEEKARALLEEKLQGVEGLTYQNCELDLLAGNISIDSIQLSTHLSKLLKKEASKHLEGTLAQVSLEGIHWWDLAKNRHLKAEKLHLAKPKVRLFKTEVKAWLDTLSKSESGKKLSFHLENLECTEGNFYIYKSEESQEAAQQVENVFFSCSDIKDELEETLDYTFSAANIDLESSDALHRFKIKEVKGEGSEVRLSEITFKSPYSSRDFAKHTKYKKSRFDLELAEAKLIGLNPLLLLQKEINTAELQLTDGNIRVLSDKNMPLNPKRIKKLPGQILAEMTWKLNIAQVKVRDTQVTFELRAKGKKDTGEVFWSDVSADLSNLTNDSLRLAENALAKAKVSTRFMGESIFTLNADFFLDSPSHAYRFNGKLEDFEMRRANRMIADVMQMRIKSGHVHSLDFTINANDKEASGDMQFYYDDFNPLLMDKQGKSRKFLSGLLKNILIEKENLPEGKNKQGEIYALRDPQQGFFHQMWKAVEAGLKDVLLREKFKDKL